MRVKSEIKKIEDAIGVKSPSDDDSGQVMEFAAEQASAFIKEYHHDGFEDEMSFDDFHDKVGQDVLDAIWSNVSKSLWEREKNAIESVIERAAERAGVKLSVNADKKGFVHIDFDGKQMLKAWREEVEGQGYAGWGGDETASDIKSAVFVVNILSSRDEVYGGRSNMERDFYDEFDRFDPDTGSYSELAKVADKALKRK